MGYNRIVKRNKIASYGKKAGKSRSKTLKQFSAFKRAFEYANNLTPDQIAQLEILDKVGEIENDEKI